MENQIQNDAKTDKAFHNDFDFAKAMEQIYLFPKKTFPNEGREAKKAAEEFFRELGWAVAPRQSVSDPHDMIVANPDGKITLAVFVRYGEHLSLSFSEILGIKKLGVTPAIMFINRQGQYMMFIPVEFEQPKQTAGVQ